MFEQIRKYAAILTLIFMSTFAVAMGLDEYGDMHRLLQDMVVESCMEIEVEDYEWDEANEFCGVGRLSAVYTNSSLYTLYLLSDGKYINHVSLLSDEHKRGLVRRYAPRKALSSHNCIPT